MGASNSYSDTQGKGRGEGAVERNTSGPSENWRGSSGKPSKGTTSVYDQVDKTRNDVNDATDK